MKLSNLILSLVFPFGSVAVASQGIGGPITRVRPSVALVNRLACQADLNGIKDAVQYHLDQLNIRRASAYLGDFTELKNLLLRAGVTPDRATLMVGAVKSVGMEIDADPVLHLGTDIMGDFLQRGTVLTCVLSKDCVIPGPDANHLVYTGVRQGAVVLLPAPKVPELQFAINFWGVIAAISGEHFLLN